MHFFHFSVVLQYGLIKPPITHEDILAPEDIFEDPEGDNGDNGNGNVNDQEGQNNQPNSLFFLNMIAIPWARYENVDEILHR